jgi:hypothetical protein
VTALALEQMVPRGRLRAVAGSTISRLRTPV